MNARYRDSWRRVSGAGEDAYSTEVATLWATERADTWRLTYRRPDGTERKVVTLHGTPSEAWNKADIALRCEGFELVRPGQADSARKRRKMREGDGMDSVYRGGDT